jgi:adenylate cyclase
LLAMADDAPGALDWVKCYEAGLTAWRAGDFTAAIDAFDKTLMLRPHDAASPLMIERCRQQLENPAARTGTAPWWRERNSAGLARATV